MESVFLEGTSESSSADEPIEHEDQVIETKAQVNCWPNVASFHEQMKKTEEDFEDLKNAVISSITLFENNIATLNAKEERLVNLSRKISSINFESTIKLNIGGHIYQTSLETLTKYPGSLLADMFSARFDLKQGKDGCYFIDRDGTHFRHVLNYLRSGKAPVLSGVRTDTEEILEEAEYYGLVGLVKAINNELNGDDDTGRENVKDEDEIAINIVVDDTRKELCATEEKLKSFLNLLDSNLKVLDEASNHHKEVSKKLSNIHFGENVKIDVGGRIFKTSLKTLRKESESVLASTFSEKFDLKKEDDGSFFIDRDGTFFQHILEYLRDGKISEDILEDYGSQIQKEAEFYGLSSLKEQIYNYNHVKLTVGGRDFVVTRDVLKQYPESIFGRMLSGKACTVMRGEDGSFCIGRDGTNFHHILEYIRYGIISDDIIKEGGVSLHDDAKFYMLPNLEKQIENYHNVKVDVGGREFIICRKMLNNFADSMLGKMLAGEEGDYIKRSDGSYIVQHDGTNFEHIITYLRTRTLSDDVIHQHTESLLADAEFYMLPGLEDRINSYHKVKLSVSGREFLVSRRVLTRFPDSIFGRMLEGKDGDYIKESDGSYCLQHDSTSFDHILDYLRSGTLSEDIIEQHAKSLLADAKFYMLPGLKDQIKCHTVKLSIDGRVFVVSKRMLNKFPDSMFGKMLTGWTFDYVKGHDGFYSVQHDDRTFHHILSYLRSGTLSDDVIEQHTESLLADADFYMLPGLKDRINNYDKVELSINGREFAVSKRVLNKFPDSMFGEMLAGKKGNYVKRHDGSYFVKHDGTNFDHILDYLRSGTLSEDIIEQHAESLLGDAAIYMLPGLKDQINYHTVKLNINGREFVVSKKLLNKFPESLFGRMLAGKTGNYVKGHDGSYFVQDDGRNFQYILTYLRSGTLSDDVIEQHAETLLVDAEFYMLPGLTEKVNCRIVKLSIDGREFVVSKKELNKFPESLFGRMLAGKTGNYVKNLDGSYFVERDGRNFHHILSYLRFGILPSSEPYYVQKALLADAEFYMLPGLIHQMNNHSVKLSIDGREFVVSTRVLNKFPESLFGRMLAERTGNYVKRDDGSYFVQHDNRNFHHILTYLRFGILSGDVIEQHTESLLADAAFYMLPGLKDQINYHTVKLSINGREFLVSKRVLNKFPESLFGRILAGKKGNYVKGHDGSYFVKRDGRNFHHILTYLRTDTLSDDAIEQHAESLLEDAEFYMLPGFKDLINHYTVKLSLNGRDFVVSKKVLNKFPESLFGRMLSGQKGNYVKRSDGSYFVRRHGRNFHHILSYLRFGTLPSSEPYYVLKALLADAEFYMLPCFKDQVKKYF